LNRHDWPLIHGGQFRVDWAGRIAEKGFRRRSHAVQKFYIDMAISGSPTALPNLLALAKPEHIL